MMEAGEPAVYRVTISPRAQDEVREIYEYVRQVSPQNAVELVERIFDDIDGLSIFPQRYRPPRAPELKRRDVRSMPVFDFLVYYQIDDSKRAVRVISVQHGARQQRL